MDPTDIVKKFLRGMQKENYPSKISLDDLKKCQDQLKRVSYVTNPENLTKCVIQFIDLIVNYASTQIPQIQYSVCKSNFGVLKEIIMTPELKNIFVERVTRRVFDIVIEENTHNWCMKRELLNAFNYCIDGSNKMVRSRTVRELSDMYILKMIDSISSYGDYDLQVQLIELVFRMYGQFKINKMLKDLIPESQELSQTFAEIKDETFVEDIRVFLNSLNKISGKLFSIICESIRVGEIVCLPAMDNIDGHWVDFNLGEKSITWYCSTGSFCQEQNDEDEIVWTLLTIFVSDIESVNIHSSADNSTYIIYCTLSGPCLCSENYQDALDKADNLSILVHSSEKATELISEVLPRLFGKKIQQNTQRDARKKVSTTKSDYKPLNIRPNSRAKSVASRSKSDVSYTDSHLDPTKKSVATRSAGSTSSKNCSMDQTRRSISSNSSKIEIITIRNSSEQRSYSGRFLSVIPEQEEKLENAMTRDVISVTSSETSNLVGTSSQIQIFSGRCSGSNIKYSQASQASRDRACSTPLKVSTYFEKNKTEAVNDSRKTLMEVYETAQESLASHNSAEICRNKVQFNESQETVRIGSFNDYKSCHSVIEKDYETNDFPHLNTTLNVYRGKTSTASSSVLVSSNNFNENSMYLSGKYVSTFPEMTEDLESISHHNRERAAVDFKVSTNITYDEENIQFSCETTRTMHDKVGACKKIDKEKDASLDFEDKLILTSTAIEGVSQKRTSNRSMIPKKVSTKIDDFDKNTSTKPSETSYKDCVEEQYFNSLEVNIFEDLSNIPGKSESRVGDQSGKQEKGQTSIPRVSKVGNSTSKTKVSKSIEILQTEQHSPTCREDDGVITKKIFRGDDKVGDKDENSSSSEKIKTVRRKISEEKNLTGKDDSLKSSEKNEDAKKTAPKGSKSVSKTKVLRSKSEEILLKDILACEEDAVIKKTKSSSKTSEERVNNYNPLKLDEKNATDISNLEKDTSHSVAGSKNADTIEFGEKSWEMEQTPQNERILLENMPSSEPQIIDEIKSKRLLKTDTTEPRVRKGGSRKSIEEIFSRKEESEKQTRDERPCPLNPNIVVKEGRKSTIMSQKNVQADADKTQPAKRNISRRGVSLGNPRKNSGSDEKYDNSKIAVDAGDSISEKKVAKKTGPTKRLLENQRCGSISDITLEGKDQFEDLKQNKVAIDNSEGEDDSLKPIDIVKNEKKDRTKDFESNMKVNKSNLPERTKRTSRRFDRKIDDSKISVTSEKLVDASIGLTKKLLEKQRLGDLEKITSNNNVEGNDQFDELKHLQLDLNQNKVAEDGNESKVCSRKPTNTSKNKKVCQTEDDLAGTKSKKGNTPDISEGNVEKSVRITRSSGKKNKCMCITETKRGTRRSLETTTVFSEDDTLTLSEVQKLLKKKTSLKRGRHSITKVRSSPSSDGESSSSEIVPMKRKVSVLPDSEDEAVPYGDSTKDNDEKRHILPSSGVNSTRARSPIREKSAQKEFEDKVITFEDVPEESQVEEKLHKSSPARDEDQNKDVLREYQVNQVSSSGRAVLVDNTKSDESDDYFSEHGYTPDVDAPRVSIDPDKAFQDLLKAGSNSAVVTEPKSDWERVVSVSSGGFSPKILPPKGNIKLDSNKKQEPSENIKEIVEQQDDQIKSAVQMDSTSMKKTGKDATRELKSVLKSKDDSNPRDENKINEKVVEEIPDKNIAETEKPGLFEKNKKNVKFDRPVPSKKPEDQEVTHNQTKDPNQTLSTTLSGRKLRKLYDPNDVSYFNSLTGDISPASNDITDKFSETGKVKELIFMNRSSNMSTSSKQILDKPTLEKIKNEAKNDADNFTLNPSPPVVVEQNTTILPGIVPLKKGAEMAEFSINPPKKETKTTKARKSISKTAVNYRDVKNLRDHDKENKKLIKTVNLNTSIVRNKEKSLKSFFDDMLDSFREEMGGESILEKLNKNKLKNKKGNRVSDIGDKKLKEKNKTTRKSNLTSEKPKKRRETFATTSSKPKPIEIDYKRRTTGNISSSSSVSLKLPKKPSRPIRKVTQKADPIDDQRHKENNNMPPEFSHDRNLRKRTCVEIAEENDCIPAEDSTVKANTKINIISDIRIKSGWDELPSPPKKVKMNEGPHLDNLTNRDDLSQEHDVDNANATQSTQLSPYPILVSKRAPSWQGSALLDDKIVTLKSTDYLKKYLVMFFFPADFGTLPYVCEPMEILSFNERIEDFRRINVEVVACSVDSYYTHIAWVRYLKQQAFLEKLEIPLLSDANHHISKSYKIYSDHLGHTFRGVFIIDPQGIIMQEIKMDLIFKIDVDIIFNWLKSVQSTN